MLFARVLPLKHRTLTAAFATNHAQGREWLTLDSVAGCESESHWLIDNNSNPMDAIEQEETTTTSLKEIYSKLTPKQTLVAELLLDGKSYGEVATILNITKQAVALLIKGMRVRLEG